jgi:hypothetical protein
VEKIGTEKGMDKGKGWIIKDKLFGTYALSGSRFCFSVLYPQTRIGMHIQPKRW